MKDLFFSKSEELVIIIFTLTMLMYDFMTLEEGFFKNLFDFISLMILAGILYFITITIIVSISKLIIKKINEWFKE